MNYINYPRRYLENDDDDYAEKQRRGPAFVSYVRTRRSAQIQLKFQRKDVSLPRKLSPPPPPLRKKAAAFRLKLKEPPI